MSFEAQQSIVGKLLNDSVYRIPRNQRSYVWEERNWNDLYQDIELVVKRVSNSHFIGSVVLMKENPEAGLGVYTVIDGQQRMITLTILLTAISFALKQRGLSEDAAGTKKFLIATDVKNDTHVIVSHEKHLSLERLIEGTDNLECAEASRLSVNSFVGSCCISKSKDKQILDAFKFFSGRISSLSNEELIAFRDALIETSYVKIESSSEEDSYTIFEILNARGLELEDHELLKNYVMRYINPAEKRDDAKVIWADIENLLGASIKPFLRHYAIHKYRLVKSDKEGPYKKIRDFANPEKASDLLYDLQKKAGYYNEIINPSEDDEGSKILVFFKGQNVKVFRPLFMSLMHCRELEVITEEDYEEALEFLYRFYVCYKIIGGLESANLVDSIARHSYFLETKGSKEALDEWKISFSEKLPSKASFESSLSALGWSNRWDLYKDSKLKDRCHLVLALLEQRVGKVDRVEDFTIEHALPDSAAELNSMIGNLLPLEVHLNERCKDLPLKEKLPIYAESRFATTRSFANRYSKTEFRIQERSRQIACQLYEETSVGKSK